MKKDNFECNYRNGESFCRRRNGRCVKGGCDFYLTCETCKYNLYTLSQEPCSSCQWSTMESVLEYVRRKIYGSRN